RCAAPGRASLWACARTRCTARTTPGRTRGASPCRFVRREPPPAMSRCTRGASGSPGCSACGRRRRRPLRRATESSMVEKQSAGWSRTTRRLLGTALSLALGCSSAGSPPSGAEKLRPSDEPLDGGVWLGETAAAASAAGAGPPGDHISTLVNVPAGRCALFFARGSDTIEDLDLFAYGDEGALLGADEAPDEHPTLLVCPDVGRRLYVSARVSSGHGLMAL